MILGAVLAGGQSTRFGSDKALAMLDGQTLLTRAIAELGHWCPQVVVIGRKDSAVPSLPDWPRPGMGPLGAIAAALRHAQAEGFDAVLTCGVDSAGLPADLPDLLSPAPAFLASQPVIGLWPASAFAAVEAILAGNGRHSMRRFAETINAREVALATAPANINTPADLAALEMRDGL